MSAPLPGFLPIWHNPVFRRFCRSQLRLRKSIFWYLLTLIVTTFVVAITYIVQTHSGRSPGDAARSLWIPILIIQGVVLMVKGTGDVSAGLIQDKIDETLDYQRLTPMSPLRKLWGYLFGLPVQEYVLFALTLPHLAFVIVVGDVPLTAVVSVYAVFFSCVVLYSLIGIAAGLVMRRWIWGYLLSIALVLFVNAALPAFISQFGLSFFRYLSIWPVVGQKLLPVVVSPQALERLVESVPYFAQATTVPFFDWSLSAFAFTLLLQGALIVTFLVVAVRRMQSASRHLLSKPYALALLAAFIVVFIGNLWPAISGRSLPFALFGNVDYEDVKDAIGIALPLIYASAVWTLCILLFAIVLPSHQEYMRGIRRALRPGAAPTRAWHDDAGGVTFASLFVAIALVGFWFLFHALTLSGARDAQSGMTAWHLPVAFGLVLIETLLLLQVVGVRRSVLVVLLLWLLPLLVAIVWIAAAQEATAWQTTLAALSPVALIVMTGTVPFQIYDPSHASGELAALLTGVYAGLAVTATRIGLLWWRWKRLQADTLAHCRYGSTRVGQ